MSRAIAPKTPALREAAWAAAERLGVFGWAELQVETGLGHDSCMGLIRLWEKAGAINQVEGPKPRSKWAVDRDFVWPKERNGTAEDRLWLAMRKMGSFQPGELAHSTHDDAVPVTVEAASAYCQMLLAAGYLRVQRRAAPSMKRQAIYQLTRPTGIQAPVRRLVPALFDPNTDALILLNQAVQS
jgi:hypothetical protein